MSDIFAQPVIPVPRISLQAFCEQTSTQEFLKQSLADRRLNRVQARIHMGGIAAALATYREAPTPNLIVIESFAERGVLIEQLDSLAETCDADTKVIVIGRVNDIILYRELIARGVSEYIVHPFDPNYFVRLVSNLYAKPGQRFVGRMIAVTGVKGGVGASTLAHNLGWAIARYLEQPTVIVDMDLPFGTAGLDFNQDPPQGIAEAVHAQDRLDTALVERLLTRCDDHLSLLAAPALLDRQYDLSEESFDPLLQILRSTIPYIVLDLPHGWPGWKGHVLASADEVVVVAGPDLASLRNAKSAFDYLRNARPEDLTPRLVMNGVGLQKRPEIPASDFAKAINAMPDLIIPYDAKTFCTAANNGQMVGEMAAGARFSEMFRDLAKTVTGRTEVRASKKHILTPILARLRNALA